MLTTTSKTALLGTSPRVSVPSVRSSSNNTNINGRSSVTLAFAAGSFTEKFAHSHERVLRYPDGRERRIRYPVPSSDENSQLSNATATAADEDWETRNVWKARRAAALAAMNTRQQQQQERRQQQQQQHHHEKTLPTEPTAPPEADPQQPPPSTADYLSSPLALLRYLTSDAHKEEQRRERADVERSYEILQGCPWPIPRPLYVLAARQQGTDTGLTHTLRTRLPLTAVEDELTRLLRGDGRQGGKKPTDGDREQQEQQGATPFINCSELVDGLVTFEVEEDAERYGNLLEESGAAESVAVVRCDSHELFRSVQGVRGVVVLVKKKESSVVPAPHQLAAAVRKGAKSPLDSVDDDDDDS